MKTLVRLGVLVLAMAAFALGCSAQRAQVQHSDENFISASGPARLVVQISNVTDENKSRRNQIELVLNGKKMRPSSATAGRQNEYLYELTLPSGVHKIQGKYRAKSFWKDKEFQLATHDGHVRLYPGYTTFLTMSLEKKSDGSLTHDKVFFTEVPRLQHANAASQIVQAAPEPKRVEAPRAVFIENKSDERNSASATPALIERPLIVVPVTSPTEIVPAVEEPTRINVIPVTSSEGAAPVVSLDRNTISASPVVNVAPAQTEIAAASAPLAPALVMAPAPQVREVSTVPAISPQVETATTSLLGKIALQINTAPANADVIVDDKYLGQSPLIIHVERGRSHVIQISKKGYADKMKLLDFSELANQQTYFLIEKLEKEE